MIAALSPLPWQSPLQNEPGFSISICKEKEVAVLRGWVRRDCLLLLVGEEGGEPWRLELWLTGRTRRKKNWRGFWGGWGFGGCGGLNCSWGKMPRSSLWPSNFLATTDNWSGKQLRIPRGCCLYELQFSTKVLVRQLGPETTLNTPR